MSEGRVNTLLTSSKVNPEPLNPEPVNAYSIKEVTKMKRLLTVLGILIVVGVIALPVLADGPGWGRG